MNLNQYKAKYKLTNDNIADLLNGEFPMFKKQQVTMVTKGTYGVVLAPKAVQILKDAQHIKENRVKGNTLTVRLNDYLYALLLSKCESEGRTKQDEVEAAIYSHLKPDAVRTQPDELNSRLRRDLRDCRNELCLRCGQYTERHLGACDGCRWKEMGT